ncbi:MAG: hypothetical protein AB1657_02390 [Candidatus Micrarchaeota archaeon]
MANLNMITEAFRRGFSLTGAHWKGILREFLKVNALAFAFVAVSVIAGFLVITAGAGAGEPIAAVAAGAFAMLVFVLVSAAASSVSYNIIDEEISGARHEVLGDFGKNLLPVAAYTTILWLIIGIFVFLPSLVARVLGETSGNVLASIALSLASQFYYYAALFVIGFVLQFALFELVVARAAVVRSIENSAGIVKRTLLETFLFHIIGGIFSTIVQLVLLIPAAILILVPLLAGIWIALAAGNAALNIVLIAAGTVYLFAVLVAYISIKLTITLPINYHYWKMAREIR